MATFKSPFAKIFKALVAHVKAEMPEIVYIDRDLGQLETIERPSVAFPCVLISFLPFNFNDLGENVQDAMGMVALKVAFNPYSSTEGSTPETFVDAALEFFELEEKLQEKMHGWSPGDDFQNFTRGSATDDNRRPGLSVRIITYKLASIDYTTQRVRKKTAAELKLAVTAKKKPSPWGPEFSEEFGGGDGNT